MARSRTLLQLREEVRQRADMVNSAFVTNAEVDRCINQSWAQLYDRLLATGEDYYIKYVDLGPQAGVSTSSSSYTLTSVGMQAGPAGVPVIVGTNGWMSGAGRVVAMDMTTGALTASASVGNVRLYSCFNGTELVYVSGLDQVRGLLPTTPTPTPSFLTTAWVPPLAVTESIPGDAGVFYDQALGEYLTLITDSATSTARVVRFTVSGSNAVVTLSSATFSAASGGSLLYNRTGRVAVFAQGAFYEFDTTTLVAAVTISGLPADVPAAAYDPATQRAVLAAQFSLSPAYPVIDLAALTIVGSLDSAIAAIGGSTGPSLPTLTPSGKWLVCSAVSTPSPTLAGAPMVVEADPATLACKEAVSIPASCGYWALETSAGALIAARVTNPFLSIFDSAAYVFTSQSQTSTDYANFEDYIASNGQPATDVYQVRGVDAVYSSNLIVNLPRYNWEERNLYNAVPELTPYSPISAYRVIQNPLNGKDCMQFIPGTPNGVSHYRVWYYPNPKVLTADTDTIDGRSGWEEWVVVDAAMKLLAKEESDTSQLEREAQRVWARIMAVAENRDAGQSKRITDVSMNSGTWPYPTGFPRRF